MTSPTARPLRRILGLGFGLAMVVGGTIGVGILRLPGTVAAALGDARLVAACWVVGGIYAILGAVAVAELAAMFPEAGGFRVYAKRAFGDGVGFVIGWSDWLNNVAALAYATISASTFLGAQWPLATQHAQLVSMTVLVVFTTLHWFGIRIGSTLTNVISLSIGLILMLLVVSCFVAAPVSAAAAAPLASAATSLPWLSLAMFATVVTALRAALVTYDGWYSPIYMSEESTEPTRTLPRALVGGAVIIAVLYVLINLALLRVLPLSVLAASPLAAADAARAVLPRGGAELVTVFSIITVLSLVNASLLMAPRILLGMGRDGYFLTQAAAVSGGGTPRVALAISSLVAAALILTGTFEQIIALAAVLFLVCYLSAYASVFVLRRSAPDQIRPFRAFGYPVSTAIALIGSACFLIAALSEDHRSAWIAGVFVLICGLAYRWIARRRKPAAISATPR